MEDDTASGEIAVTLEPFAEPTEPITTTGAIIEVEESAAGGMLSIGVASAPAMTVFVHPSSPYSREFMRTRMPAVIERFVETGTLRVLFALLPIAAYPGTEDAGRAMVCGLDQGKGYAAFARMFEAGATTLTEADLDAIDADTALFATCVSAMSGDTLSGSRSAAANWNVTLVPTYVLDGEVHVGLPTEADLLGAIKAAL